MRQQQSLWRRAASQLVWLLLLLPGAALAQDHTLLGVNGAAPPAWHCPDANCDSAVVTQPGDTVEPETRRTFFLDCPSDYQSGDRVSVIMSLHGFGSYANWQRHYFPAMDVKDRHNLVVITPGSPTRFWSEADDGYLHNIVDMVIGAIGKENVDSFILAGHSQGGLTSRRLVCTDYFRDKVDIRISLSGGAGRPGHAGRTRIRRWWLPGLSQRRAGCKGGTHGDARFPRRPFRAARRPLRLLVHFCGG